MQDQNTDERLPTATAAPYCGFAPSTFKTMRARKKGPAFYKLGKEVTYRRSDLDAWIESRRVVPELSHRNG